MSDSPDTDPPSNRLPLHTLHCRFCNHLLLATTRALSALPARKEPARDAALILPLPATNTLEDEDDDSQQQQNQKHYSILLATAVPDRRATMIRRDDGFEKRWLLRCGRCRVVMGYYLDGVHFPESLTSPAGGEEGEDGEKKAHVVYLLPAALVETGTMLQSNTEKLRELDRRWRNWADA